VGIRLIASERRSQADRAPSITQLLADRGAAVKSILALAFLFLAPAAAVASNVNYGTLMFMGDSITVGQDGSNSGYRGFLIEDLNPVPYPYGAEATPQPGQGIFSTVGTNTQMASPYLQSLGTPGYYNPYIQSEGHSGATIQDLYDSSNGTGYAVAAMQNGQPNYVYLMIGSNNSMDTAQEISTNLTDELSLISYIQSNDSNLSRIFVEPPPSYPSLSNGSAPNGYDTYAAALGAALLAAPYDAYTTFVDSRPELTNADFSPDGDPPTAQYLHPNDAGYQIIANDFYDATITAVPEPGQLGFLCALSGLLVFRARRGCRA
jgi:lysophospholipase L1-like esterase